MITYEVTVFDNGTKHWYLNGKCHREGGPAVEWADGTKKWYLNGECVEEEDVLGSPACDGKIVEIDGVKYELRSVK